MYYFQIFLAKMVGLHLHKKKRFIFPKHIVLYVRFEV